MVYCADQMPGDRLNPRARCFFQGARMLLCLAMRVVWASYLDGRLVASLIRERDFNQRYVWGLCYCSDGY